MAIKYSNIKSHSIIVQKNIPGGKDKFFKISSFENIINFISNLFDDNNFFYDENFVYFQMVYNFKKNIPSKSIRFFMEEKLKSLDDVFQKDFKVETKNDFYQTFITYKIDLKYFENFKNDFKEIKNIFAEYNVSSLKEITLLSKNKKIKSVYFKKIIRASVVSNIRRIPKINFPWDIKKSVSFYGMYKDIPYEVKKRTGIDIIFDSKLLSTTLNREEFEKISESMPWLIMGINEYGTLSFEDNDYDFFDKFKIKIPEFENDKKIAYIGVIDTSISLPSELSKYVLYSENYLFDARIYEKTYNHGNSVCSLIIANDYINPNNKDGYGNFYIKHFGLLGYRPDTNEIAVDHDNLIYNLERIISENKDIKVWNLSFGSIRKNWKLSISKMGMFLDYLSKEYDCLFVVASGNDGDKSIDIQKTLNSPGDSLNALTVGSVCFSKEINSVIRSNYSSLGAVTHYYKPEVSSFGGPYNEDGSALLSCVEGENDEIILNQNLISGTSFATSKISRMAGFFIKNGYSVLETKASIIALANQNVFMKKREWSKITKTLDRTIQQSSCFGYISGDLSYKENFLIKSTIKLKDNKPHYIPIYLKKGLKIVVSSCNFANPIYNLGEEYSISNVSVELDKFSDDINLENIQNIQFERNTDYCKSVNDLYKIDYEELLESYERMEKGKYFTSHKLTLNIDEASEDYSLFGLRVKRLNLFTFEDGFHPDLEMAIVIYIEGIDNLDDFVFKNKFTLENYNVIENYSEIENLNENEN